MTIVAHGTELVDSSNLSSGKSRRLGMPVGRHNWVKLPLLSCCVQYEQFIYPAYDAPLMEAYGGAFESVYVILHPFVSVPDELAWKATKQYPSDEQILSAGAKYTWAEVVSKTRLGTCARLNQALLTSIGSINEDLVRLHGERRAEELS